MEHIGVDSRLRAIQQLLSRTQSECDALQFDLQFVTTSPFLIQRMSSVSAEAIERASRQCRRIHDSLGGISAAITSAALRSLDRLGPCLLPSLQPVRHCFHPFLSDTDAARLM